MHPVTLILFAVTDRQVLKKTASKMILWHFFGAMFHIMK
jgi:hypothetical protein